MAKDFLSLEQIKESKSLAMYAVPVFHVVRLMYTFGEESFIIDSY
jgi:hypothetical protein